jgi:hypothetical protein
MAKNNSQVERGSSILAMMGFGGFRDVPVEHEKQNAVGHALNEARVDKLAQQLRGQSPAVVLQVLGAEDHAQPLS